MAAGVPMRFSKSTSKGMLVPASLPAASRRRRHEGLGGALGAPQDGVLGPQHGQRH
eukprot:CAMPEP_0175611422 /NCGR_PEP_ID=MMETSP0096-20121207/63292_1 /TAXON_ID=311494 /ORGANISM="Alexandrium monilatum, Strain CCMP3105" /LENGTH=55 /DNA_ID=CAMNT_0016916421 /DNA_START=399 /DNA_END=563 /DNA_ORIENTATION=+